MSLDEKLKQDFPSLTGANAFEFYERVRHRLPSANFSGKAERFSNLGDIADQFDVFVFDAYGVLNSGEFAVPEAAARVRSLRTLGKRVFVLTNGAGVPAGKSLQKYHSLGFDFKIEEVISSRDAALEAVGTFDPAMKWGVFPRGPLADNQLELNCVQLGADASAYNKVDGFIFLSSAIFDQSCFDNLRNALRASDRPLIVGNPDVVAPHQGVFSLEPGYFSHRLADEIGIEPQFYGKPFPLVYEVVQRRIGDVPGNRIAMMGDTLHTDVLGAASLGWTSVLVSDHGLFAGHDVRPFIEKSGIVPDFIVPQI